MERPAKRIQAIFEERYPITRSLGRGGTSMVFLAEDRKHHRQVALKVLRPELAASLGYAQFLQEIQIAAQLIHPHILPLYDSGEADGFLYYVMPFVEGESLRERLLRERRLPVDEALEIAREVADALAYAHERGVIHRDIKPENILLTTGHAVVADFGIARAVSAAGADAPSGEWVVGTPGYMSPEQASGEPAGPGSDVYALGCVLYEMLAGKLPTRGTSAWAAVARDAKQRVPSLHEMRPEVTPGLERTVERAMEVDPARRFETAAALRAALEPDRLRAPAPPRSIAVLPFVNLSSAADTDYLGDGIAEEITTALSKIRALRVASRTSAFGFRATQADVRAIGEQLGVATVLEGSVQQAGSRLRVSARLVDVDDGCQLWSERYDRELRDVFAIQDEIAQSIGRALQVILSAQEAKAVSRVPTPDVEAYQYYLRGRQFFHRARRKSLLFARDMFHRAIELDGAFALAHVGLANTCALLHLFYPTSEAALVEADRASRRAVELAPELPEVSAARGFVLFQLGRSSEAEPMFRRTLEADPQQYEARYYYARLCFQHGRFEDAARLFEAACEVREDWDAQFFAAQSLAALGQDAVPAYRRALDIVTRHLALNPDDARAATMRAVAHMRVGETAAGLAWAERAVQIDPEDAGVRYNVACLYSLAGEIDRAIDDLYESLRCGFGNVEWFSRDPDLEPLRGDPRFQALLAGRGPVPAGATREGDDPPAST